MHTMLQCFASQVQGAAAGHLALLQGVLVQMNQLRRFTQTLVHAAPA
jgi:hypothetical protein